MKRLVIVSNVSRQPSDLLRTTLCAKGSVLNVQNPPSIPATTQLLSWLKPKHNTWRCWGPSMGPLFTENEEPKPPIGAAAAAADDDDDGANNELAIGVDDDAMPPPALAEDICLKVSKSRRKKILFHFVFVSFLAFFHSQNQMAEKSLA